MAVRDPQTDRRPGLSGGSDAWDDDLAGQILSSDYFEPAGGASGITQGARFDNSQTFYGGVVTAAQVVTQGARFDNSQTFYGGVVTATQPVAQTSRFDNPQTFYGGIVLSGQPILQTVRFDNSQVFYGGDITGGAVVVANGLLVPPLRRRRR